MGVGPMLRSSLVDEIAEGRVAAELRFEKDCDQQNGALVREIGSIDQMADCARKSTPCRGVVRLPASRRQSGTGCMASLWCKPLKMS